MKIKTAQSYNLDVLCFLNVLTADDFYVSRHRQAFDEFYPKLSQANKENLAKMVEFNQSAMLSARLTLSLSALKNFNTRNLIEMLNSHEEIKDSLNKTVYKYTSKEYSQYFSHIQKFLIPVLKQLEELEFFNYWQSCRLPLITEKCKQLDNYLQNYDIENIVGELKTSKKDTSDCTVYICSFCSPLGIKICGNNLISDCAYSDKTILSNVTHEIFHPPYDYKKVKLQLNKIAKLNWFVLAHKNQNPNSGYKDIFGFIEENIVEALGIFVLTKLNVDINPKEYFAAHDYGSHVLSPYFYDYLCSNKKPYDKCFEDYFKEFVSTIK